MKFIIDEIYCINDFIKTQEEKPYMVIQKCICLYYKYKYDVKLMSTIRNF